MLITLAVMLWARNGLTDELADYEDEVLELVRQHHGLVISRVRCTRTNEGPDEIQVIQFRDQSALDAYMTDPRRQNMSDERDRVVARTVVVEAELVTPPNP